MMLIDEKRMDALFHGKLYENRMTKAFSKKMKPRQFALGKLVWNKIFPHQGEAMGSSCQIGKVHKWFIRCFKEE